MSSLRLATFNCENLFARYNFRKDFEPLEGDGFTINNLAFDILNTAEKRITAQAIAATRADIIALQEVENLLVLDRFHSLFMRTLKAKYPYRILVDGNDPRNIDVAVLSKYPIVGIRTYRHEEATSEKAELFSRDCLEVEVEVDGRPLTLFVNHLKSMMGGRGKTRPRRVEQVARIMQIIDARFGSGYDGNFAVLGDFNDYAEDSTEGGRKVTTSLAPLLDAPFLVNVNDSIPDSNQRWTHWFKGAKKGERARQLDYIFMGKAFYERAGHPVPEIERRGLPYRAEDDYDGERFDHVGEDSPKASDHCPVTIELPIKALLKNGRAKGGFIPS